jgi:hypothetical protein
MAEGTNTNIFGANLIDLAGLGHFWRKVRTIIEEKADKSYVDETFVTSSDYTTKVGEIEAAVAEKADKSYVDETFVTSSDYTTKVGEIEAAVADKVSTGTFNSLKSTVDGFDTTRWTTAAQTIEDFVNGSLQDTDTEQVINTLKEIQDIISGENSASAGLLADVAELKSNWNSLTIATNDQIDAMLLSEDLEFGDEPTDPSYPEGAD